MIGEAITKHCQNRLTCFWDFADRWSMSLPLRLGGFRVLGWRERVGGRGTARRHRRIGCGKCARGRHLRRVFRHWRKRHHAKVDCRCHIWASGSAGGFSSALQRHFAGTVLCVLLTLCPTALPRTSAKDVIDPVSSIPGSHHVSIMSPFEREAATKSGCYDETVTLGCTALANHMPKTEEPRLSSGM